MRAKGGLRKALIMQTWNSVLIAWANNKYYTTAVLLKTIANYLGVKIPDLPYRGNYSTKIEQNYTNFCESNMPRISALVDEWLSKHTGHDGEIQVMPSEESDDDE